MSIAKTIPIAVLSTLVHLSLFCSVGDRACEAYAAQLNQGTAQKS